MFCWRQLRILALLLILAGFSICPAQTADTQDLTSLSLEELTKVKVYSASRHLEEVGEAPSAVTVITAEDISRCGWRTLADVLRSLRGFYTSYDRSYSYLGLRGFQRPGDYNSRILLLINGHRINDNVYDSAQIGTEFPLDLDLIDHIEVVRGPSSSLFGTNAVFGVVNVVTRRPSPETEVETSADNSSFLSRTGRLSASLHKNAWNALLSGSLYRSDGPPDLFYPEFVEPDSNGVAHDLDGDRYAHFFADLQRGNLGIQGLYSSRTKLIPTASYGTAFGDAGTRTADIRAYLDASYHHAFSDGTELETRVFFDHYDSYGSGVFGDPFSESLARAISEGYSDWIGSEAVVSHQYGRHRLTGGADYEYNLQVVQKNYFVGGPSIMESRNNPWLAAAFGEAELNLVPKLTVHVGGRMDWYDTFGSELSPRLAFVFKPNSGTSLKYIFGRAFRSPNAYENYYADGVVIEPPSGRLKPENITTHEVIVERTLYQWLRITADAYHNSLGNLIDQEPDPETGLTHFVNSGQNRGRGVEFELEARRASGLAVRASYALSDARDQKTDIRLANSPLHVAKINATIPLRRRFFASPELLYESAQQSFQNTRVSPWLLANFTVSTKPLWGGWEFSGSCYNLFDRRWYAPSGPELRQPEIQQDGRTYRFKISYRVHLHRTRARP